MDRQILCSLRLAQRKRHTVCLDPWLTCHRPGGSDARGLNARGDNDACVSPVLSPHEAARHPHAQARASFAEVGEVVQPTPGPRFSLTPGAIHRSPVPPGTEETAATLERWGIEAGRLSSLRESGAVAS